MERVHKEGPPGRAAANTMAFMARSLKPSAVVDPNEAMHQILQVHPERAWKFWFAWREHLPWNRERMHLLLSQTVGLHRGLIKHFDKTRHDDLQIALRDWEPHPPHSERWEVVQLWLQDPSEDADSLSQPQGADEAR